MTNPLSQIRDRRKPWQKKLVTLKLAKCGAMLAERAADFGRANAKSDLLRNKRSGRYGEVPSDREVQYWLHMTGQKCPHHANLSDRKLSVNRRAAADWLKSRGLFL